MTELRCQGLLIDVFDTLLYTPESPQHLQRLAEVFGVSIERITKITDDWQAEFENGLLKPIPRMQRIATTLGLPRLTEAEADELIALETEAFIEAVQLFPGAIAALDAIRELGIVTAILSNANPIGVATARRFGLIDHVDHAFFSCEIGICKPNLNAYKHAAAVIGVPRSRIFFVGDGENHELTGAQHVKMTPIRVHPWLHGGRDNPELAQFHRIIERIADLPDYISNVPQPTSL